MLDLGVAARALVAVNAETVNLTAFPCCAAGGACCPDPAHLSCCSHGAVDAWMRRALRGGAAAGEAADLMFATRTRWYDQAFGTWRPQVTSRYHQQLLLSLVRDRERVGFAPPPRRLNRAGAR